MNSDLQGIEIERDGFLWRDHICDQDGIRPEILAIGVIRDSWL
jgi:hypothetical protein